ncbi:MAG: hypothetical protein JST30_12520 [Armatimonadetes bacterium]|nr:hypothetical protein [Armatimonadota bacterium]
MERQTFVPMLSYEDGHKMMDWLAHVFGLEIKERWTSDDGSLSHGELEADGQVLMLATPTPLYLSPSSVRSRFPLAARAGDTPYVINGVLVRVGDVREVFERAVAAGAVVLSPIEEGFPGTRFRMEDPEGQRWFVIEG